MATRAIKNLYNPATGLFSGHAQSFYCTGENNAQILRSVSVVVVGDDYDQNGRNDRDDRNDRIYQT